jgi:hypothetical protein
MMLDLTDEETDALARLLSAVGGVGPAALEYRSRFQVRM